MNVDEAVKWTDNNGYLSPVNARAYANILEKLPDKGSLLEIGTGRGDSATFFSMVKPEWIIYTVDSYKCASEYVGSYGMSDMEGFVRSWKKIGYKNILPIIANSFTMPWETMVDVLYIDGDHKYEAVKSDFERFSPFVKKEGYIFFDDYTIHDIAFYGVDKFVDEEVSPNWHVETYGSCAVARRK